jgi:hypothetical protein
MRRGDARLHLLTGTAESTLALAVPDECASSAAPSKSGQSISVK